MRRLSEHELLIECVTSVEHDVKRDTNVSRYNILTYQANSNQKPKIGQRRGNARTLASNGSCLTAEYPCAMNINVPRIMTPMGRSG